MRLTFICLVALFACVFMACSKSSTVVPTAPTLDATISTSAVINMGSDTAIAGGILTANGDATIILIGVCYDTLPNPDVTKLAEGKAFSNGSFTIKIKNLLPGKTYYARAFYTNTKGTTYGNQVSFVAASYGVMVGYPYFNSNIYTLCTDAAGNIYAGGAFWHSGNGLDYSYVGKWNGSTWSELGNLKSGAPIRSIISDASSSIYAGVLRHGTGVEYYVAKWSGSWNDVGIYNNNNAYIMETCLGPGGNVYAIGTNTNAGGYYVAKWGPGGYSELGSFNNYITTICTDAAGNVYVAGLIKLAGPGNHYYVAKWNGTTWTQLGDFNNLISSICIDASDNLIVSGVFTNASNKYYVAKYNGTSWSEVGNLNIPYNYFSSGMTKIIADKFGNLYATGDFKNAKGLNYVMGWNGSGWSELAEFNGGVNALCTNAAGHVFAGGNFRTPNNLRYIVRCK